MNKVKEFNQINKVMNKKSENGPAIKQMNKPKAQEHDAKFFHVNELELAGHYIDILSGRPVLITGIDKAIISMPGVTFKYFNPITGTYSEDTASDLQLYRRFNV